MHFQQTTVLCYSPHKSHDWRLCSWKGEVRLSLPKKKQWFFSLWGQLNHWYTWVSSTCIWVLDFKHSFWFCSEEDLLSLCVNVQELVLKSFYNTMKGDVKERLVVIWRGVTDDWPTLSSMFTSTLLWQIGPIDSPKPSRHFARTHAAECWLFESYRHDGISKFNPLSSGRKSPLWCSTLSIVSQQVGGNKGSTADALGLCSSMRGSVY